jgi:hypothetical protein
LSFDGGWEDWWARAETVAGANADAGLEAGTESKEMDVEGSVVTVEAERTGEGDAEGVVDVREAAAAALAIEADS